MPFDHKPIPTPHPMPSSSPPQRLRTSSTTSHSPSPSIATRTPSTITRLRPPPLPATLRTAVHPRASSPHLSLVFAQSDPTTTTSSNLSRSSSTLFTMRSNAGSGSASEEALTRQLDRDSGGDRIGLRSRRSSSATVRSIAEPREGTGLGSASASGSALPLSTPSPTVKEEDEEEATNAAAGPGPSTKNSSAICSSTPPATVRGLNPKKSSSWLRWSSPTPSFPKSPSRKGKEVDRGASGQGELDQSYLPSQQCPAQIDSTSILPPPLSAPGSSTSTLAPPLPPPEPEPPFPVPDTKSADPPSTEMIFAPQDTSQCERKASRGWLDYIWSSNPAPPIPPLPANSPTPDTSAVHPPIDITPNTAVRESSSAHQVNSLKKKDTSPAAYGLPSIPLKSSTLSRTETNDTTISSQLPVKAEPSTRSGDTVPQSSSQGWAAYIASFVVNPKPQNHPSLPTSAVEDQKPVLSTIDSNNPTQPTVPHPTCQKLSVPVATGSAPDVVVETAQPAPLISATDPSNEASLTRQRIHSQALSVSQGPTPSSSSGWLNYLILRSAKKISANTGSIRSDEARKSTETVREEVMDLEGDPDFPTGNVENSDMNLTTVSTAGVEMENQIKKDGGKDPKVQIMPPPPVPKSYNLSVRKKRLSNASKDSLTLLSSSPKNPSIDSQQNIKATSALPPPSQPAARQPNFVIPSFQTTFDRPPRSFLPLPPEQPRGVAAATTGLAWKAIGAVGSYVYGDGTKTAGTLTEDEKETRGRKEGRKVGADLPRRIGLGSGTPDDGWKHVRRVTVVGVHGWFPAKLLNPVIGEPTGTSQKFANMMGDAVRAFFKEKGVDDSELRITLIPLEGEGTIDSRVDRLYKAYLSNPAWINDLRRADAIFFAAHSQGCIVTTHLISRLIAQGHIRTPLNREAAARCEWAFGPVGLLPPEEPRRGRRGPAGTAGYSESKPPVFSTSAASIAGSDGGWQKVAMLAMCGIHQGPLYSISTSSVIQPYLQWFENAAARELFEFQDTSTPVSEAYQHALSMILENGVRVLLLSSLNDQVVPIYGASFSCAHHPLLLRALFVDGASFSQSDFMTNLLCFAFMLRNAGIDDQRLVEHLSEATAGSLTGVGHSTPYEEPGCYSLAVEYLFLSGPANIHILGGGRVSEDVGILPPLKVEPFLARDARNDYELPWIMRALVDSPEIKDLFPGELRDLRESIGNWKPQTKALKEIKKRLEPMAGRSSKLRALPNSPSNLSLASAGGNDQTPQPSSNQSSQAQLQGKGTSPAESLQNGQVKLNGIGLGIGHGQMNGDGMFGVSHSIGPGRRSRL